MFIKLKVCNKRHNKSNPLFLKTECHYALTYFTV